MAGKKTDKAKSPRPRARSGDKPKPKAEKAPPVSRVASVRSTRRGGRGR